MSKKACFEAAAQLFCDSSITITNPIRWDEYCMKHGDPGIDPNNLDRIKLPWRGEEIAAMYNVISQKYKDTMKNWTKGKDSGPCAPEDYSNWKKRDVTEYYQGYACKFGAGLELTWIYMSDVELGLLLYSRFEGLPKEASFEDGEEPSDNEGIFITPPTKNSSVTSKKSQKSATKEGSFNQLQDAISATVGKLEHILSQQQSQYTPDAREYDKRTNDKKRSIREIMDDISEMDKQIDKCKCCGK
mmetsp:Transcript_14524/g.27325  ORF Transcript_14524/g.27325 Transcript_14524/m.27325 type:complete len:244 (-) Transcript_14524:5196-5927(-)